MKTASTATQGNPKSSVYEEAQRADFAQWKSLHHRINDFTTARLIVEFLDQHPSQKVRNMGVYLCARETVQRYRIRCAKRYRVGFMLGTVVRGVGHLSKMIFSIVKTLFARSSGMAQASSSASHAKSPTTDSALSWPVLFDPTRRY